MPHSLEQKPIYGWIIMYIFFFERTRPRERERVWEKAWATNVWWCVAGVDYLCHSISNQFMLRNQLGWCPPIQMLCNIQIGISCAFFFSTFSLLLSSSVSFAVLQLDILFCLSRTTRQKLLLYMTNMDRHSNDHFRWNNNNGTSELLVLFSHTNELLNIYYVDDDDDK